MKKTYHYASGATLLELLTAIALSGIVISLILATYTNFTRGFMRQIGKADQVQKMLLVKKQIDRAFEDVAVVVSQQEKRFEFKPRNSEILRTFHVDSTIAAVDSHIISRGLSGFKCSILQEQSDSAQAVLTWEACIGTGWIGGAKAVVAEQ